MTGSLRELQIELKVVLHSMAAIAVTCVSSCAIIRAVTATGSGTSHRDCQWQRLLVGCNFKLDYQCHWQWQRCLRGRTALRRRPASTRESPPPSVSLFGSIFTHLLQEKERAQSPSVRPGATVWTLLAASSSLGLSRRSTSAHIWLRDRHGLTSHERSTILPRKTWRA